MAQFGRALGSGPRGRWFKSSHSDQKEKDAFASFSFCLNDCGCTGGPRTPEPGIKGTQSQNAPVRRFGTAFPPKAGRNGSKAVLCARFDHATAVGSAGSNPVTPTMKNGTRPIGRVLFFIFRNDRICTRGFLIVPNQRFGIKRKRRTNAPMGRFIEVFLHKAGRKTTRLGKAKSVRLGRASAGSIEFPQSAGSGTLKAL